MNEHQAIKLKALAEQIRAVLGQSFKGNVTVNLGGDRVKTTVTHHLD